MKQKNIFRYDSIMLMAYVYLLLPILIFAIGWCKWYFGIVVLMASAASLVFIVKEKEYRNELWIPDKNKVLVLALIIIMIWVALSGVGGYVWQNSDHKSRNILFQILVNDKWPVRKTFMDGKFPGAERGLVYYIGFWLPSAVMGKIFGIQVGYASQYIWAVLGVYIVYLLLCRWRRKCEIWPLVVMICFSGLDFLGELLIGEATPMIFGESHLEWWSFDYQFSSMTTQLFWVFNQAIPAWVACMLLIQENNPKCMLWVLSLLMLSSTFPFIGLIPFGLYFMVYKMMKRENRKERVKEFFRVTCSVPNLLGVGVIGILSFSYLLSNDSGKRVEVLSGKLAQLGLSEGLVLLLAIIISGLGFVTCIWIYLSGKKCLQTVMRMCILLIFMLTFMTFLKQATIPQGKMWITLKLILFWTLEVGVYVTLIGTEVKNRQLLILTAVILLVVPNIVVGSSKDFCMRASIPALFYIMLLVIETLDQNRKKIEYYALIICLLIGFVTPLHEMIRTLNQTKNEYVIEIGDEQSHLESGNFSGFTDNFYWRYIAK